MDKSGSTMELFLEQLVQLQRLREAVGPAGVTVMNWVSQSLLPLLGIIPLYIFWCCDKKAGYTMAFAVSVGSLANHLLKLTCCVERPWLLDSRIAPPDIALKNQGGYSFPSGHAQLAAGYLAGAALWLRRKKLLSAALLDYRLGYDGEELRYDGKYTAREEQTAGELSPEQAKAIAARAAGVEERELKEEYD